MEKSSRKGTPFVRAKAALSTRVIDLPGLQQQLGDIVVSVRGVGLHEKYCSTGSWCPEASCKSERGLGAIPLSEHSTAPAGHVLQTVPACKSIKAIYVQRFVRQVDAIGLPHG